MRASQSPRRGRSVPAAAVKACAILLAAVWMAGCTKQTAYVPPPPPEVGVAQPLQQTVTIHLEQTGNTVAFNTVDLVARVRGLSERHQI